MYYYILKLQTNLKTFELTNLEEYFSITSLQNKIIKSIYKFWISLTLVFPAIKFL